MQTTRIIGLTIGLLFLFESSTAAQELTGTWHGSIFVMGTTLPLVFDINHDGGQSLSTLQSPKQSNQIFDVDSTYIITDSIFLDITAIGATYAGAINGDSIIGRFTQYGNSLPLTLHKGEYIIEAIVKPQDPLPPFPYTSEDIIFTNTIAGNHILAGTLTLPPDMAERTPIVILISGSGAQNRNEEILGHKPFLVLSDYLTRAGTAVLRYDDRGTAESEGDHSVATSFDFATDVEAAIEFLKTRPELSANPIGLIGHSEGALIAPIVICNRPSDVEFFVSLAGPGVGGKEILVSQTVAGLTVAGANADVVAFDSTLVSNICDRMLSDQETNLASDIQLILDEQLRSAVGYNKAKYTEQMQKAVIQSYTSPWMRAFVKSNPTEHLSLITCPTLLLNGDKDVQVLADLNLPAMKKASLSSGNKDVTATVLPELNHLFQTANTGSPAEYGRLEETFSPKAMKLISDWILERF